MGMSLPVDFLPKILITGDQNPVFVKRFFVKLGRHLYRVLLHTRKRLHALNSSTIGTRLRPYSHLPKSATTQYLPEA